MRMLTKPPGQVPVRLFARRGEAYYKEETSRLIEAAVESAMGFPSLTSVLQSFHPTSMTELDYQTEVLVDTTSSCHLLLKDKVPTLGNSEE